ncbi:MAG: BufA1 family periplasmic bufferin-type metallophore [Gemmatimonadota bacterium]
MDQKVLGKRAFVASVIAAAIAVPTILSSQQGQPQAPSFKAEKCYGIAKAGKNDCAATGNNSCAGTSKLSGDTKAWMYVPAGYCERIVNGSTEPR